MISFQSGLKGCSTKKNLKGVKIFYRFESFVELETTSSVLKPVQIIYEKNISIKFGVIENPIYFPVSFFFLLKNEGPKLRKEGVIGWNVDLHYVRNLKAPLLYIVPPVVRKTQRPYSSACNRMHRNRS